MITSWSFSRWGVYNVCPLKAKYKFIDKLQEPGSAAMDRGTDLHKQCEEYLGKGGRIPKELKLISNELKLLRKEEAICEAEFAFNKSWEPVGWFDKDTWCRVKADAVIEPIIDSSSPTVEIKDFKSGKVKEGESEYTLQLELYSLAGLLVYPIAEKATSSLIFIDHGVEIRTEGEVLRKDLPKLKKKWEVRVKPMLSDKVFKPRPGNACRWCHFSKSKNGPCKF